MPKFRVGDYVTSARPTASSARFDGVVTEVRNGLPGHPIEGWWYRITLTEIGPLGQTEIGRAENTLRGVEA